MAPSKTSGLVLVGTTAAGILMSLLGAVWVGKHQKKKAASDASDSFSSLLASDIPKYEDANTKFSDCILELYPHHKEAFSQLLTHLAPPMREKLAAAWKPYTRLYMDEEILDTESKDIRNDDERKRILVVKILHEIQGML